MQVITIDASSTTEVDDGLSVEHREGQLPRIWVHIADPSRWVQPDSVMDRVAAERATSVYLPAGVTTVAVLAVTEAANQGVAGLCRCSLGAALILSWTELLQSRQLLCTSQQVGLLFQWLGLQTQAWLGLAGRVQPCGSPDGVMGWACAECAPAV